MFHPHANRLLTCTVVSCLLMATIAGCSSSSETRRGKLSDAMEKASEENKGDRKVPTEPAQPTPVAVGNVETRLNPTDTSVQSGPEQQKDITTDSLRERPSSRMWLGIRLGGGTLKAGDFEGIGEFGVSAGSYISDRFYGEVWGFFSSSTLIETAALNKSIKDGVIITGIGLEGKYFLTPSYTFLGPYLLLGMNFSHMSWDYQNAITANKYDNSGNVIGTDRITSDALSGLDMFVGAGLHLFQFSGFHVGAELAPGLILWSNATSEGFDNDVFKTFFYLKFRVHINFGL